MKQKARFIILFLLVFAALAISIYTDAQTMQHVTGSVFDEASHAPLTGVVVSLVDSTSAYGTISDEKGGFKVAVPLGRHAFRFSYTGYEERLINDIIVTAGKEVSLNIGMQEAIHKLNEVSIVYNKAKDKTRTNNDMAQVSARSFNVDETKRYAGALGDPSRMAANFAGVASGNDAQNDIVVRGNSPLGMLWQMEGLNIPNPNHYGSAGSTGGPISMMNNNNIDKSDFMTSAFPAQYGNALAGVFDIRLRDGNKNKNEFMGQLGFNGLEFGAEGPLGKNKNTSYLINYRYSALGLFQKMGISFGTGAATPYYQDVNYKITTHLSKKATLKIFGIAGSSGITFLGKDVDTTKSELYSGDPYDNEYSRYATTITGTSYENQLSEKTFSRITLGYSTTYEKYDQDSISTVNYKAYPNFKERTTTSKMSANWMLMHKINAQNNIEGGVIYDVTNFSLLTKGISPVGPDKIYYDRAGSYSLAQTYVQWKHRFTNAFSAVAGMHFQYHDVSNAAAAEPRVSFRYVVSPKQAISVGYGLHSQAQNIYAYYVPTDGANGSAYTNKSLGFTNSHQAVVTYDWNINSNMRIKAEAYYQLLNNVPVEQRPTSFSLLNAGTGFDMPDVDSLVNKGKGNNYGLEITFEHFFNKGFYCLVTTSLFQSRYSGSDGIERNTAFNSGHVFNALAGKEFRLGHRGSVIAFNLKVTNVGGRYLTPIDLIQSAKEGQAVYKYDKAFSLKQPDYFRTDFRVAYRKEYRKSTLEVAIDLQNLTNHQNVFYQRYDTKTNSIVTNYQQSFFPVPTIRFTF